MTGAMMNPCALVENIPYACLLREMINFVQLIEIDVEELTEAACRPIAASL
jgi:hypothetical protein